MSPPFSEISYWLAVWLLIRPISFVGSTLAACGATAATTPVHQRLPTHFLWLSASSLLHDDSRWAGLALTLPLLPFCMPRLGPAASPSFIAKLNHGSEKCNSLLQSRYRRCMYSTAGRDAKLSFRGRILKFVKLFGLSTADFIIRAQPVKMRAQFY